MTGIAGQGERALAEVGLDHQVLDQGGTHVLHLLLHLFHQPGTLDRFRKTGVVLDVGGDRQLTAGLHPANQDRLQVGSRRVKGRRVAGGAGTDDENLGMMRAGHVREISP